MEQWGEYLLAGAAFMVAHLVPALRGPRASLVRWLGRRGYLAAFSLLSVALLAWLIAATGRAPFIPLWDQTPASRVLVNVLMPVAFLVGCCARGLSGLVAAFAIWSGAHLIVNGDLAHALFFGCMLLFAISGLVRSGLPHSFAVTPLRMAVAIGLWLALLMLHPVLIGVSPLP